MDKLLNCGRNLNCKTNNCCTNSISEYHAWTPGDMEMPELREASGLENKEFLDNETRQEMQGM